MYESPEYLQCSRNMHVPCEMIVAISAGKECRGQGCVVSYSGSQEYGIQDWVDVYAAYLNDFFLVRIPICQLRRVSINLKAM